MCQAEQAGARCQDGGRERCFRCCFSLGVCVPSFVPVDLLQCQLPACKSQHETFRLPNMLSS